MRATTLSPAGTCGMKIVFVPPDSGWITIVPDTRSLLIDHPPT
jgi:hypothetical protein